MDGLARRGDRAAAGASRHLARAQDAFAARSHRLADEAWRAGFYDDLVVPVPGVDLARDESIRADTTTERLAGLRTSFRAEGGTVTAGNASPLNDGASAVLLGSAAAADELGLAPIARIAGRGASALDPQLFGYRAGRGGRAGSRTRRDHVGRRRRRRAQRGLRGAVPRCVDAWGIDPEIVNRHGGAIAIGHPLGASGGRILGTLARSLERSGDRWGVACICIGVGQGLAVVLENVSP